jgi:hypothetical protein
MLAPRASLTRELLEEPALADSGLAADQKEAAASRQGLLEPGTELCELPLTTDELLRRQGRHACGCHTPGEFARFRRSEPSGNGIREESAG